MNRIPQALAAALLAGVLARFAIDAFLQLGPEFALVAPMLGGLPDRPALVAALCGAGVLALGVAIAAAQGRMALGGVALGLGGAGVHRAGLQRRGPGEPGAAAVRGHDGVAEPARRGGAARGRLCHAGVAGDHATGVATLLLAPFGGYALNLAAITGAICMGREAHEDPARRYTAVMAGVFYVLLGLAGGAVVGLIAAFPQALVLAVAGFALLGTIGGGLAVATRDEHSREPALITFLVTASGLALWGVGSAFWGVVAGSLALAVQHWRKAH
jgi:benzoate membrane transport protein